VFGRIAIWFLFLEYEVVYKPNRTHVVANVLSKLPDSSKPLGVPNQTMDASLYSIELMGMQKVKSYLETCQMLKFLNLVQKQKLARKENPLF
jgi:hypothetical protein